MHAAPTRYVSVSELYATDEVELLLDEIRELEPTSCRGEDVQDFEIAGSGCEGGAGGRSPAGTELTERSWDSHAQYLREPPPQPLALAPLYCHLRYLITAEGFFTIIIVLCSVAACACVWGGGGGGARLGGGARPLALGALSSLLLHGALLFARLTELARLMPLDWPALGMYASVWTCCAECAGASVLLHAVLTAPRYAQPDFVRDMHSAAVGVGYCGALAAAALVAVVARRAWAARRAGGGAPASRRSSGSARGAYRAVPTASTSRHAPL